MKGSSCRGYDTTTLLGLTHHAGGSTRGTAKCRIERGRFEAGQQPRQQPACSCVPGGCGATAAGSEAAPTGACMLTCPAIILCMLPQQSLDQARTASHNLGRALSGLWIESPLALASRTLLISRQPSALYKLMVFNVVMPSAGAVQLLYTWTLSSRCRLGGKLSSTDAGCTQGCRPRSYQAVSCRTEAANQPGSACDQAAEFCCEAMKRHSTLS